MSKPRASTLRDRRFEVLASAAGFAWHLWLSCAALVLRRGRRRGYLRPRAGNDLFVGGGGNGDVPNYATPEATDVSNEAPGGPFHLVVNGAPVRSDGQVSVEWGSITKDPTMTEVVVPGWKVTRASGRRTITLAWPIQKCVGLPEPEISRVKVAWGSEKKNGKFPAVITVFVSRTTGPGHPCATSGMSKRIKLARPLSKTILLDGSSKPAHRETVPGHYSPLKIK